MFGGKGEVKGERQRRIIIIQKDQGRGNEREGMREGKKRRCTDETN